MASVPPLASCLLSPPLAPLLSLFASLLGHRQSGIWRRVGMSRVDRAIPFDLDPYFTFPQNTARVVTRHLAGLQERGLRRELVEREAARQVWSGSVSHAFFGDDRHRKSQQRTTAAVRCCCSNAGHQLLLPPANWCPTFAVWTTVDAATARPARALAERMIISTAVTPRPERTPHGWVLVSTRFRSVTQQLRYS